MARKYEVYKCEICGNIVEILHGGKGQLVCCGEPMKLMKEQTDDSSTEKHVPFIEKKDGKTIVKVGENTSHPMEEKHYIEWIELQVDGKVYKKHLQPGEEPKAVFEITGDNLKAREYCNVHGLWKG
ncbi:MAG: desulfoferrodoxin [Candidatus Mcinerneyibacterium aminivorans]|jgi:superoxide reductase|uniref:Desulfoferrodoxin n=1 Tax=Candidatus Mcinerneyibacterium aminivorans TaxID=2703815 RepID=A0A5D0MH14_9BACT|nr:MAG: desulfoferrodoxin [Candidatus Mcinerneyibacterium aminivorans]